MKKKLKYWYEIFIEYCPVCGKESRIRERRYGEKPDNPYNRKDVYDWCEG